MAFSFLNDMGEKPSMGFTIERIDNDGNYEPSNCKWASRLEQAQNRRTARLIEVGGVTRSLSEWARATGLKRETIADRLNRGWSPERAIQTSAEN